MPPIRLFPDAVLRERSGPVKVIDDGIRRLMRNLVKTMHEQPDGVGLAAPQLGVPLRVFVFDVGDGTKAMINPVIESADGSEQQEAMTSDDVPVRRSTRPRLNSGISP